MADALRALLIEDSEVDAALIDRMLRQTGRNVVSSRIQTAAELRAALAEQTWDVVIADYQLPTFSAPAALAILQEHGHDIPFIVVSGTIGEAKAVAMMKAGAQDYLMKSNLPRLAPAVIREVADARSRAARREAEAAQVALQARLLESQRDAYTQLGEWHRRLELTKDDERRSLARELHDEMGQTLTALKLRLKHLSQVGPTQATTDVSAAIGLVDDLIARVRRIAIDLRPPLLDELGLEPALRAFLESTAQLSVVSLHVDIATLMPRLNPEVEMACFRIVQEAVTNILKHAGARNAWVRVAHANHQLSIVVQDDGCGFSAEAAIAQAKAGHFGLVGMRERTRALGGSVMFSAPLDAPGAGGTRIEVALPA